MSNHKSFFSIVPMVLPKLHRIRKYSRPHALYSRIVFHGVRYSCNYVASCFHHALARVIHCHAAKIVLDRFGKKCAEVSDLGSRQSA